MRVVAQGVSKGSLLAPISAAYASGEVALVPVEGERRSAVLGLVLSGRMTPDTGEVTLDGEERPAALRDAVCLVDAPDVSSPPHDLTVTAVLREELVFAGVRGAGRAARRILADPDLAPHRDRPIHDVPVAVRLRILTEGAVQRPGVAGVVLVAPDRHGGDPADWLGVARGLAGRGLAVAVLVGGAALAVVGASDPVAQDAVSPVAGRTPAEADGPADPATDGAPGRDGDPVTALLPAAPATRRGRSAPPPSRAERRAAARGSRRPFPFRRRLADPLADPIDPPDPLPEPDPAEEDPR